MSHRFQKAIEKAEAAQNEPNLLKQAVSKAAKALEEYLKSIEGEQALRMLGATEQFVRLAEDDSTSARNTVWFLDRNGLQLESGLGGLAAAYANEERKKRPVKPITAEEAVTMAHMFNHVKPEDFMNWLHEKLEEIAKEWD